MLSEAKHPACLRQSAGFFVAALLRMTDGATAAARYRHARHAAPEARRSRDGRLYAALADDVSVISLRHIVSVETREPATPDR